ncbi:glycan-binding surface protein [Dyadobacter psychrophilus]|uniref:IPT/TIG domain-containing protein n=1 Tax=Dyadobacter psychrophilus TaxID=651661 RepID=A0A1T5DZA7_9BACT|nr:glycan-binding surface protein [Dyadobacter psychrophilus]SKB77057.1 IPT/TIG domain-containing protein [Dyadobacter psychrophilus]
MNFKNIYNTALGLCLAAGMLLTFQSCNEDDVDGAPSITNVRLLDPTKADSSLNAAEPGTLIVIQGQNLGSVMKVYFNDFEATFNAALGSNSNLIVTIPANAPTKAVDAGVSNKIKVQTKGGETTYDFVLSAPMPVLTGLYSEFVKPGGTLVIQGDYFYNIKSVKVGATNLQILSTTVKQITAKMPVTAISDVVTVEGEFGTVKTAFKVNGTEGHMINFDVPATTWGSDVCYGAAAILPATDPGAISGKYSRIKQTKLPATGYADAWVFATCNFDFKLAAGPAAERQFKFEHNIAEPWKAGKYDITITAGGTEYTYAFQPWNSTEFTSTGYQTTGWRTAVIELSEFKSAAGGTIADVSKVSDLKVSFGTPDVAIASFNGSVDNFRIVKK